MKKLLALALVSVMMLATACGPTNNTSSTSDKGATSETKLEPIAKKDLKVGFVYIGDTKDGGYTQSHDAGRLALEADGIECSYVENVDEEQTAVTGAIQNLIDANCNVIYTTSFGFGPFTEEIAAQNPDIYFGHATGGEFKGNMTTYMGKVYEARYLAGIVAAMKTTSNKIGYVAAKPIGEVIRGINAFTLGVKSINPEATVEVIFTNTWYDPTVEKTAALNLLNKGCDVLTQHQDSTATQKAAEEKGAFCIGYNKPTPDAAPRAYLTAPLFHWEKFYTSDVQKIIDGTWKSENVWNGLDTGMVSLDKLTSLCPEGTQAKVDEALEAIKKGDLKIFAGEIKNQKGEVKVKKGEVLSDENIWNMNWFVEGVIGSIN